MHVLCVLPSNIKGKKQQRLCLCPEVSVVQPDEQPADDVVFSVLEASSFVLEASCSVLEAYSSVLNKCCSVVDSVPITGSLGHISLSQQQSPVSSQRSSHQQSSSDPSPHLPLQLPLLLQVARASLKLSSGTSVLMT